MSDDSMLLIMHAETYNAVLRQHHYRQKQLSSATALLSELPLFKVYNYSKIASIAYTMRSQTYSAQSTIVSFGQVINNVILIVSGQVKVFAAPLASSKKDGDSEEDKIGRIIEKRIPRLAVSMLGRGQIIGEMEMHKNCRTFQMTYEAGSASTEVLEMPATVYKESVGGAEFRQSQVYKSVEEVNDQNEQRRATRLVRAYDAMKSMMGGSTREVKSKDELLGVLPVIVDPYSSSGSMSSAQYQPGRKNLSTRHSFNNPDVLKVTRKPSFGVTLSADETLSPKEMAMLVSATGHRNVHASFDSPMKLHQSPPMSSPSAPLQSKAATSSMQSPRTASLKATMPSKRLSV